MNWLNYHHLFYFYTIARLGSIANASKELNTTQSSLSSQLKSLENSFGFSLFDRVGKRLELTNEGIYIYSIAEKIFEMGQSLMHEVDNKQLGSQVKNIRIGAVSTLSKNIQQLFVSPIMQGENKIKLRSSSEADLMQMLKKFELDFVITDQVDSPVFREFNKYLIRKFPYCLVTTNNDTNLNYLDLIREQGLITPELSGHAEVQLELFLKRNELDRSIVRAEVEDTALLRLFAVNGDGVVLIPKIGIYRDILKQQLRILKHVKDFEETFYLTARPDTYDLLNLDIYISHFRELFQRGDYD